MATIIIRIELHRQVANRLFKTRNAAGLLRKLGRLASQYAARLAAPARTVKKDALSVLLLFLFMSSFVILVARYCSRQQAVSHSLVKGVLCLDKKLLRHSSFALHTHYICEMTAFP